MVKERKEIDASFFMEKPVVLFRNDKDRTQRRDGILIGSQKGQITSFLRTDVKRIQLADATHANGGGLCG
jgi:hypothetical protein